jgi:RNA recognition motif-containing protein
MQKWLFIASFGCLLLLPPLVFTHPFYVSVTEVHVFENRAELSVRIFTDDFESALKASGSSKKVDLIKREPANIDSLVARYINQHLIIFLNKKQLRFQYVGFEIEQDATWAHFEANFEIAPRSLQIENTLLLNLLPQQQNIVHVKHGTFRRTRKLSASETEMHLPELR